MSRFVVIRSKTLIQQSPEVKAISAQHAIAVSKKDEFRTTSSDPDWQYCADFIGPDQEEPEYQEGSWYMSALGLVYQFTGRDSTKAQPGWWSAYQGAHVHFDKPTRPMRLMEPVDGE